jgi:hypothetical protein
MRQDYRNNRGAEGRWCYGQIAATARLPPRESRREREILQTKIHVDLEGV